MTSRGAVFGVNRRRPTSGGSQLLSKACFCNFQGHILNQKRVISRLSSGPLYQAEHTRQGRGEGGSGATSRADCATLRAADCRNIHHYVTIPNHATTEMTASQIHLSAHITVYRQASIPTIIASGRITSACRAAQRHYTHNSAPKTTQWNDSILYDIRRQGIPNSAHAVAVTQDTSQVRGFTWN